MANVLYAIDPELSTMNQFTQMLLTMDHGLKKL
ncbi:hypothetical protein Solca_1287 [Solitalea canadensis DSM 3403]|uniref:Uncharacterized protein n=1 Tax=Solitalea canadensis (strain ATCC 29591 / DSM 3403 / JCM 21819 / LMG 8368 / NBRC 15130 / NCIMB 12057 / USAM 9D) TaxID=929556 RepID=H8KQ81_SOLCM|nr:hypothetical protein Solca_1287 [Solitalea canadensis DSM 3403]